MPKGPFHPSEFVPTKFSTAQDKADFGNAFLHFIESEWARTAFSKSFYNRLSMCFSHIAHYDCRRFLCDLVHIGCRPAALLAPHARLAVLGRSRVHVLRC